MLYVMSRDHLKGELHFKFMNGKFASANKGPRKVIDSSKICQISRCASTRCSEGRTPDVCSVMAACGRCAEGRFLIQLCVSGSKQISESLCQLLYLGPAGPPLLIRNARQASSSCMSMRSIYN